MTSVASLKIEASSLKHVARSLYIIALNFERKDQTTKCQDFLNFKRQKFKRKKLKENTTNFLNLNLVNKKKNFF